MTSLQIPINLPTLTSFSIDPNSKSCCLGLGFYQRRRKIEFLYKNRWITKCSRERWSFGEVGFGTDGILMRRKRKDGSILVRANQGFGFNGGGGGGGSDKGNSSRVLGNLAFAVGLTYLSMTGQLGWILDAIVSIWLIAVLLPIVGLGAFFWYAGRDIVQSSCPNCGNDFQILKSSLKDGIQLCPFCTQPFSEYFNLESQSIMHEVFNHYVNLQPVRWGTPYVNYLNKCRATNLSENQLSSLLAGLPHLDKSSTDFHLALAKLWTSKLK